MDAIHKHPLFNSEYSMHTFLPKANSFPFYYIYLLFDISKIIKSFDFFFMYTVRTIPNGIAKIVIIFEDDSLKNIYFLKEYYWKHSECMS